MRFATSSEAHRELVPRDFWSADPDARVCLHEAHEMLERGVERVRDDGLGLKLGQSLHLGIGGPFDYVMRSAPTLKESFDVASSCSRLLTDSLVVSTETLERRVVIRIDDGVSWPRSAADFGLAALYKLHIVEHVRPLDVECWFPYAAPKDVGDYERAFKGASLRFGAPLYGFSVDRARAEAPAPFSDPVLHSILRAHVDSLVERLSGARFATLVRRRIANEIRGGFPNTEQVARSLHVSQRTLSRKLEQEGTSFSEQLDAVRRELALEHVKDLRLPLAEVAYLLRFSHVESFHRAFKRWTGETPLRYRRTLGTRRHGAMPATL